MLEFGQPLIFWIFVAGIAILPILAWRGYRRATRSLQLFAAKELLPRLSGSICGRRRRMKAVFSLFACLFLLFALARPQFGTITEEIEFEGIDILFALDTSRSMLAEDYRPNRLEYAKLAIFDLVTQLQGDRVGLIAFAGDAFLQSPLTLDYGAFLQTLQAMTTDTIPQGGTDISRAIDEAYAYFEETDHHRVLILISDGEDLEGQGAERARKAAEQGVTVFTVGVGNPDGELVPIRRNGSVDYLRGLDGEPVLTRLDEGSHRKIADVGGGIYRRLGQTGGSALGEIYAAARETVDQAKKGYLTREIPVERYQWPLAVGLVFLVLDWMLGTRRREKRTVKEVREDLDKATFDKEKPRKEAAGVLGLLCLILICLPETVTASPRKAARAYQAGDYELAVDLWRASIEKKGDDAALRYNLGNAFYRAEDFESAIGAYREALPLADLSLQERIFYNLANAQYRLGEQLREMEPEKATEWWEEAQKNYVNALALNPNAADALENQKKLEEEFEVHGAMVTIGAEPEEGGTTSSGGRFLIGTVLDIEATPAEEWEFLYWEGGEVEEAEAARTKFVVQRNTELRAVFVETAQLDVRAEDAVRGSAKESGRYRVESDVPIEAEANDHFAFKEWKSDRLEIADPFSAKTTVKLTQDGSVVATFVEAYFLEVVSDPSIAGNVGPTGYFEKRTSVPIQAAPRDGFSWLGWSGEDVLDIDDFNAPETEIMMNGDRRAVAQFQREWNLVVLPDRDEAGTTTGGGNFPVGSEQPIEAVANDGFIFVGWEGEGVSDPESAQTTVTVLSDAHDVIAVFEQAGDDDSENDGSDDQNSENQDSGDSENDDRGDDSEKSDGDDEEAMNEETADDSEESETPEDERGESESESDRSEEQFDEPIERESPERLTEEEALQMLQLLRQDERQLPLRPESDGARGERSAPTRDW